MASWADVVASGHPGVGADKISEEEISGAKTLISNGVISLAEEVDPSLLEHWKFGLVGRFKAKTQPLEFVRRALSFYLGRARSFELLPAPGGSFLIILETEAAMDWTLSNGPWPIGGNILFLEPWVAGFDFSSEVRSLVPTWVYFPHLPKRLFSRSSLIALASIAGRPLLLDPSSSNPSSSLCARVRVLCDLASPLPDGISVEVKGFSFWQAFRFGSLPKSCSLCGLMGHSPVVCPLHEKPAHAPNVAVIPPSRGRSISRRRKRINHKRIPESSEMGALKESETVPEAELVVDLVGDVSPQRTVLSSEAAELVRSSAKGKAPLDSPEEEREHQGEGSSASKLFFARVENPKGPPVVSDGSSGSSDSDEEPISMKAVSVGEGSTSRARVCKSHHPVTRETRRSKLQSGETSAADFFRMDGAKEGLKVKAFKNPKAAKSAVEQ